MRPRCPPQLHDKNPTSNHLIVVVLMFIYDLSVYQCKLELKTFSQLLFLQKDFNQSCQYKSLSYWSPITEIIKRATENDR